MLSYFWRWLKTAILRSLGPIDLWIGLTTACLVVVDHYWPAKQIMTAYAWQIPIFGLAAAMLVRLLLAPYWMAQEDAAKSDENRKETGNWLALFTEREKLEQEVLRLKASRPGISIKPALKVGMDEDDVREEQIKRKERRIIELTNMMQDLE